MSTPAAYRQQLIQLQPRGKALPIEDSVWQQLLGGMAIEFSRVHGRMDSLAGEILLQRA